MKKILSVLSAFCVAFTLTAQTELLENPGFEEATSSPLFGAQFEGWGVPTGSQIETTDVHSGEQALKVNSNSPTENNNIDQEIGSAVTPVFVPGNTYRISIWYKVLTPQTGGDVKFASYWNSSRDGELEHDSQILKTDFFTASEWTEKVIETTCPAAYRKWKQLNLACKYCRHLYQKYRPISIHLLTLKHLLSIKAILQHLLPSQLWELMQHFLVHL